MATPYTIFPYLQGTTEKSLESKVKLNQAQKLPHTKCSIFSRGSPSSLLIAAGACWTGIDPWSFIWHWDALITTMAAPYQILSCNMTACSFFFFFSPGGGGYQWFVQAMITIHFVPRTSCLIHLITLKFGGNKNQSPLCFQLIKNQHFLW